MALAATPQTTAWAAFEPWQWLPYWQTPLAAAMIAVNEWICITWGKFLTPSDEIEVLPKRHASEAGRARVGLPDQVPHNLGWEVPHKPG